MANKSYFDFDAYDAQLSQTPAQQDPTAYVSDMNPQTILRDPRFLNDLKEYYRSRGESVSVLSDEDLIDKFYADQTWGALNTVSAVSDAAEAMSAGAEDKQRLNRIRQVYDQLPAFWQQGGRGTWEAVKDAIPAIVADPINLIPGVNAYAKGAVAARGAALAGQSALRAGVTSGARAGAISEGLISGGQEAIVNAANQTRDVQLGLRDGFSTGELAGSTAIGALTGGVVGGGIGALTGVGAARQGIRQADAGRFMGMSDADIASQSFKEGEATIARADATTGPNMPAGEAQARADAATAAEPAPEPTPQEKLEAKWNGEAERVVAIRDGLRDRIDRLRADGADPEDIAELQSVLESVSRLVPMQQRLRKEEEEIINFGGTSDTGKLASHRRRTDQFERDYSEYRSIVQSVDSADPEAINARIDAMLQNIQDARATQQDAAPDVPPSDGAAPVEAGAGDTATAVDGSPAPASPEPEAETVTTAPEVSEPATIPWRSDAQAESIRSLLNSSGLNEEDLGAMIASGEVRLGKNGKLTKESAADIRKAVKSRATKVEAEAIPDAPAAEIPATPEASPTITYTPNPQRGRMLLAGIDPDTVKAPARSKTGKITNAQIDKAINGRAADAAPDARAAQVHQDLDEILTLIGEHEGDAATVRATVEALANTSKSKNEDILDLFDYISSQMDGADGATLPTRIETKTYKKRLEAMVRTIQKQNAGMPRELAEQVARGKLEGLGKEGVSIKGRGDSIEEASKFTTAGRTNTGRIQSFLRRGTRIGKGSDYATTADMRVKPNEFGFEAALIEARSGKGPDIVAYTTMGRETVMTRNGPTEVPKGTVAFADGISRRSFDSMEFALEYRGDKIKQTPTPTAAKGDAAPQPANNLKALFDKFGGDPEAFRRALEAVRKGEAVETPKVAQYPIKKGDKLLIVQRKSDASDVRMINPKQADAGKDIRAVIGKTDPDEWNVKYADKERYTRGKKNLTDLWNATPDDNAVLPDGSVAEGQRVEAGYASGLGRALHPDEAAETYLTKATTLTDEERAVLAFSFGNPDPTFIDKLTMYDLHIAEVRLNGKNWQKDRNGHAAIGRAIATLNKIQDRINPNGMKLDNVARVDSIKDLDRVFAGVPSDELVAARRLLEDLGGDRSEGPDFALRDSVGATSVGQYASDGSFNVGGMPYQRIEFPNMNPAKYKNVVTPRLATFFHEIGHWAYFNILSPADRAEFWEIAGRYYNEAGLDREALQGRVMRETAGYSDNSMANPAELWANQFELFVSRKRMPEVVKDEKYWQRMIRYVKAIYDRYFGDAVAIDPDLERLFSKILPEGEQGAFANGRVLEPTSEASKHWVKRMEQARLYHDDMIQALNDDSADGIINAAVELRSMFLSLAPSTKWAAENGATGTLYPLMKLRRMLRQRVDDINEILHGQKLDWKDYDENDVMPKWMSDEGLSDIGDPQAKADLLRDFYSNGYAGKFQPADGVPVNIKQPQKASIKDLMGMIDSALEGAFRRNEKGLLPPNAKPALDSDAVPAPQVSKARRKSKTKTARVDAATDASARSVTKTPAAKRPRKNPKKARTVDPTFAETLRSKSTADLRKLYREHRGTERGDQIAFELVAKEKAQPLPAKAVPIPREMQMMKGEELEQVMLDALNNADRKVADQALYEMRRRFTNKTLKKNQQPVIQPTLLKQSVLDREIDDNIGLATSDGIPPATRAYVREMLGYITHRDPEVQYAGRTLMYRMMNLMNKTARDVVGEANIMSTSDMARLAGVNPSTVGNAAFADFRAPEFKQLRSDLRRMAIGLNKGNASPIDLMHEIGHVMVRSGVIGEEEMTAVRQAYSLADDTVKGRIQSVYTNKYKNRIEPLDDLLAEEWFSENLALYMMERVAKGDILEAALDGNIGNLRMRNAFSRAIDRAVEYVAYLINGLVGRNDIKQTYRRLFLFGDMMEKKVDAPLSHTIRSNKVVHPSYAADAVSDLLMNSPSARLSKIRNFVGNGMSYNADTGSFIEFYHGTPAGYAFRKEMNPDVVLEPSRTGQVGPGVYLTRSAGVASEVYSQTPTTESMMRQIQELQKDGKLADEAATEMMFATSELFEIRKEIAKQRRKYSELVMLQQRKELRQATKERLEYLTEEEADLHNFLVEGGIRIEPMVLPTYVNVQNPADFRVGRVYEPNEAGVGDALPEMFVDHAVMMENLKPVAVQSFANDIRSRRYNGKEMYDRILRMYTESGRDPVSAKTEISGVLDDNGYDAIQSTHYNTLGIDGTEVMDNGKTYEASLTQYDALTVFDSSNVKHVDADEFNDFDDRLFYRAQQAMPAGTTGSIVEATLRQDINGVRDLNPGSVGEVLEGEGVSPSMTSAIMSMIRGRKLDVKEEQAMRKVSPFWFLQSQSSRMRDLGANWMANWYKDSFPSLHQKFAKKYFPIHHALRGLPDADGKVRAWARNASAGVGQSQPASYKRIVKALRYGVDAAGNESRQVKALKPEERVIWNQIRTAFANERQELIAKGIHVGDRGPNYLPQVWSKDTIRANKAEFLAKMEQYFKVEKTARGIMDYTDEQAKDFAEGLFETLAEDTADGVYVPIQGGSRNPKFENVDFSRVIELEKYPAMMKELEKFLEDDLEALLVKYFEGSSRRISHTEQMGVNSHAFYDYILVADAGKQGIVRLLSTAKDFRKDIRAISETGYPEYATLSNVVRMPFEGREDMASEFVDNLIRVHNEQGSGAARKMLDTVAPRGGDGEIPLAYKRRSDAIIGALSDFKGQKVQWKQSDFEFMENSLRVAMKKPQTGTGSRGVMNFSRGVRAFNSVSLLGFTTLTSLGDLVLPIIRSGEFTSWAKGLHKWKTDPEYAQFIHDTGVAMENIVHERMLHLYGAVDGKMTNAFFNATMLTPWTDMNRQIAGATGYEAFKTMQRRAFSDFKEGVPIAQQSAKYKTAARFLKSYGLGDYLPDGAKKDISLGDRKLVGEDEALRKGIIRFADDAIFQPNANDIPLWAQTPIGAMVFQLKSFPLMMTRLSRHVVSEAMQGNLKPLMYFATLGPAFGMGALAAKDIIQMRGGDDERSPELRRRNILKVLGYDEKVHGNEQDFLGWYVEGMMTMGGLGLLGDVMHSAVTQVDNGAYGKVRIASTLAGPSFGAFMSAIDVGAGAKDALVGGDNSNAKERTAIREVANRIPVVGGIRAAREGIVDTLAGEADGGNRSRNPWATSWNSGWK